MWVVGEVLTRDQWTLTPLFGDPAPLVLASGFHGSWVMAIKISVLLFLFLSCLLLRDEAIPPISRASESLVFFRSLKGLRLPWLVPTGRPLSKGVSRRELAQAHLPLYRSSLRFTPI